jgi:hypothetical protein
MSQSDYIRYKKIANELRNNEYDPVFTEGDYVNLKQFSLQNQVLNTRKTFNQLIPTGSKRIFNMEKITGDCASFPICVDTNTRTNREPLGNVYITPQYITPYVKQPTSAKTACNCILNSVDTERYICNCKTSV